MGACEQLELEICSHRGLLSGNIQPRLLTLQRLETLVVQERIRCADLDLSELNSTTRVGHPADLADLDASQAVTFPELLKVLQDYPPRFFALELKKEPMDREQLVSLLERLRAGGLPWQSIGVWYLPQDLPLFEQLHRDQHPETLGIMAVFDRPWRGAPAGSTMSLEMAERSGIPVLGMSIHVSSELLTEAQRRGLAVAAFGVNSEEDLLKAAAGGVRWVLSDEPLRMRQAVMQLRSNLGCDQQWNIWILILIALAATACVLRPPWRLSALVVLPILLGCRLREH